MHTTGKNIELVSNAIMKGDVWTWDEASCAPQKSRTLDIHWYVHSICQNHFCLYIYNTKEHWDTYLKKKLFKDNMIYTLLLKCKKIELPSLTFYLFLLLKIIQSLHYVLKA